jgi:acetoin utilization deacetylase AcuC-like enzyme
LLPQQRGNCGACRTGLGPVAILDIDYHHGNGTQDIFYADPDVYFASIHADPCTDYPFYWGHADERGEGAGEGRISTCRCRAERTGTAIVRRLIQRWPRLPVGAPVF